MTSFTFANRFTISGFLATLLAAGAGVLSDLVPNPSFESGDAAPSAWRSRNWAGRAQFAGSDVARSGKRSALIASTDAAGADASWHVTVPVRPYSRYRLSGWIKTEDLTPLGAARGALLNVHARSEATPALTGTNDWTRVEVPIDTGAADALWINCLFGGFGRARGKAWFDDVQLEWMATMKELKPAATIDASKVGEPISPYIYGQFIEHLGRCIYGGIWAEMIEDRKFYFAPGTANSPWKIVGRADCVTMETRGAFCGETTPIVQLKGDGAAAGLSQSALALIKGKSYEGRVWLTGGSDSGPVTISLIWGEARSARQTVTVPALRNRWSKHPLKFVAGATADDGRLEVASTGRGAFRVGAVSLMPADNVKGMRTDTLALLKELNAPIYRWPGGNFVSGYDWRDGIGDRDRRPPRKNPAWQGIESNDFGLDEFIVFCREVKTEPLIVVNTGFGDAASAAAEVEYVNGATTTPMGAGRAKNGHPQPYAVKWWGVGNEMYGRWQLGFMQLNHYTQKHNEFVRRMKKVDRSIKTVAVGDVGEWTEGMFRNCAENMDLLSEHFYVQERPGLAAHVALVPDAIRRKAEAHHRYRETLTALKGKDIRISMDEWNYWYGPHVFGELGTRYFLKDALGIAAGLHEFFRHSDLFFMANYAQTVNVIGCIKTTKTAAAFETTGLVLKLYRQRYGTLPLQVEGAPQPLDVHAALTPDRKTLTLGIVNPTLETQTLELKCDRLKPGASARQWQIAGSDPMVYNDPAKPDVVRIVESAVQLGERLTVAPCSVTVVASRL